MTFKDLIAGFLLATLFWAAAELAVLGYCIDVGVITIEQESSQPSKQEDTIKALPSQLKLV
ncbi:hypothetical protein GOV04_02220 [Candidatus Woesearchaeota archaeon]|nr:hypothetical protein [Candidatus Woesearchaeota archaeon]